MTKQRNHTLILGAGGTGGHIYPALSIADAFREASPSMRIVFCGEKGSLEESNVRKAGFDFYSISAYPLPVKGVGSYVSWFLKNLRGIVSSLSFLCKEHPSLVFGTGGYVTGPLITAARLCRVPYFLHEQNSIPGRANRLFAKGARCVFISYEASRSNFGDNVSLAFSGNPVRSVFQTLDKDSSRRKLGIEPDTFLILITGGSLGAQTINEAVEGLGTEAREWWFHFIKRHPKVQVVISTGQLRDPSMAERLNNIPHIQANNYIEDLPSWLSASDLYIGRAGAMTLAEVTALAKPSVLIPFPYAADNHQNENARIMKAAGASYVCKDRIFNANVLLNTIERLISDPEALDLMGKKAGELAVMNAAEKIVEKTFKMMDGA